MSDTTRTATQTPTAFFDDRADAERALRRLRETGVPERALRLTEEPQAASGAGGQRGFLVTASDLPPGQLEEARRLLAADAQSARGTRGPAEDAATDPAHAPREVQPGFADVRPGYIPEPTYSTTVDSSQHPEGVPEPRGRFEDQLDKLPEGDEPRDAERGRARVTIISPKEA